MTTASTFGQPAMAKDDLDTYDGLGLADLVRQREVSADDLLARAITRAEALNPKLNFLAHKYYEYARRNVPQRTDARPFGGVPFLFKDLGALIEGMPQTFGSRAFRGYTAPYTSELTRRFQNAGLVTFGRTTSPEFGLTVTTESQLDGPTLNPWDTSRSAGGSSGGAAVAVASGVVPMAHASDGGGSIRIPAANNGLFGMKPSRGRTPKGPGVTEGWQGLSIDHVITRSVRDSAAMLDAIAGPEPGVRVVAPSPRMAFREAVSTEPGPLRIAMIEAPLTGGPLDPQVRAANEAAAALCEELGHNVTIDTPQLDFQALAEGMFATVSIETLRSMEDWGAARGKPVGPDEVELVTAQLMELARTLPSRAYADAGYAFQQAAYQLAVFMDRYDVILSPVLAQPPIKLGMVNLSPRDPEAWGQVITGYSPFTALFNQTGQPAMSVPLFWSDEGLPIGSMFAGRIGDEVTLYQLAGQLEQARPWADRRPSI